MGSPWKMFTQDQGDKLINGTNRIWTTINGVNGYKFTSKTDSSKYIFLPAAGAWVNKNISGATTTGYYWSVTFYDDSIIYFIRLTSSTFSARVRFCSGCL